LLHKKFGETQTQFDNKEYLNLAKSLLDKASKSIIGIRKFDGKNTLKNDIYRPYISEKSNRNKKTKSMCI